MMGLYIKVKLVLLLFLVRQYVQFLFIYELQGLKEKIFFLQYRYFVDMKVDQLMLNGVFDNYFVIECRKFKKVCLKVVIQDIKVSLE